MTESVTQRQLERSRFIDDLLSYMTLEEKLGQVALFDLDDRRPGNDHMVTTHANLSRLIRMGGVSAVKGTVGREECIALQTHAVEQSRLGIPLLFARDFAHCGAGTVPAKLALAASWDFDALRAYGASLAASASGQGINWVHGPHARLLYPNHDLAPETTLGSDPLHAAQIATAIGAGMQEAGLDNNASVLACLDCEELEQHPDRDVPMIFLKNAAYEAQRYGLQSASISGLAAGTVERLARRGILKGFAGIAVNEWQAFQKILQGHVMADSRTLPFLAAERARVAIAKGELSEARIDDAVRRVLGTKYDLGLFRDPFARLEHSPGEPPADSSHKTGRLARNAMVLLRNRQSLLPLSIDSGELLVVSGHDGGAQPLRDALAFAGMRHRHVRGLALGHAANTETRQEEVDMLAIGMASDAARRAGTVVVMLTDTDFDPPGDLDSWPQPSPATQMLLRSLTSANPRIIIVLATSGPVQFGALSPHLPSVLLAWQELPGMIEALGNILSGKSSPAGRLPTAMALGRGEPVLPFGFGLGYCAMAWSDLSVELGADRIFAQIKVRNLGDIPATETVQLYIRSASPDGDSVPFRYKGARRLYLEPGESREAQFEIGHAQLGDFFEDGHYRVRPGRYEIGLGTHAGALDTAEIDLPEGAANAMTYREPEKRDTRKTAAR